ncbi:MBL fold metallo-hydrolase [Planotetraspora silvatica]|uniref:MBL fold metallo-hydrolase n=2 Tax=Planotetraspora silvatica TaxID=234614 RepID=A0A8J3XQ65_9ACTN|nr:MBL fold metallo-hydrolase [Streptosporangium sp. 'caverna']GII50512.1 MBL fold metallo-hydrolase [Planotetraspora silvatica]
MRCFTARESNPFDRGETDMNVVDVRSDLRMVLDSGPGQAYLLRRGSKVVLVDTGIAGQGDTIAAVLRDWGLDRVSLTHVVLTHWHPDHAGSAAELAKWPNTQIWAHRSDALIIRGDSYGSFPTLTHTEEEFYAHIAGSIPDAPPSRVDRELDDNEALDEIGAHVLSTPGHTDGSIALHFPNEAVLFTGDVATRQQGQVMLGPFNHDRPKARDSFRRFADIDVDVVCFGHGEPLRGDDTAQLRAAATADEVPDPLG